MNNFQNAEERVCIKKNTFNLLKSIFVKVGGRKYASGSRPFCLYLNF